MFEDEASFRQTPTLHATGSRRGGPPQMAPRGERNPRKIFGAVRRDNAPFTGLHPDDYFAWATDWAFVDPVRWPTFYRRGHRIDLIQDNAAYHQQQETHDCLAPPRRYLEGFQLPPYGPELNAPERIWHDTRKPATHNRYFESPAELCRTGFRTLDQVRRHPQEIEGLLAPFF